MVVPPADASEGRELIVLVERQLGAQHRVEDHPGGPHVHRGGVRLTADDLGRHVSRGAALLSHLGPRRFHLLREAKVRDAQRLEVVAPGHDDVLELKVPVRDGSVVDVPHALEELLHHPRRVALLQAAGCQQRVEQVPALQQLHHDVDVIARLVKVVNLHRVLSLVHRDCDANLLGDLLQAHGVAARASRA